MPTLNDSRSYPYQNYLRDSKGAYQATTSGVSNVILKSRTTPTTITRARPADLFAGGTSRTCSSYYQSTSSGTQSTGSGSQLVIGKPDIHLYATPSSSAYPDLGSVDWTPMENKIRSTMRGEAVNLAMCLAEYKQTAELFAAAARVVATRGRSLASALKRKKGISKAYLGFQYGVKPLASDMVQALEDLRNAATKPLYISGVESRRESAVEFKVNSRTATHWRWSTNEEFHRTRRLRIQWRARMSANSVRNVLTAHGFTNPFALAYELVPFSFVIDWWINVGDVLASLDNLLLYDQLKVIRSTRETRGWFLNSDGVQMDTGSHLDPHSCSRVERTDTRSSPINISMISQFRYKPSVSVTHVLNGLALLNVARGRFPSNRR